MSISFDFTRLRNLGRDIVKFVSTTVTDVHQFLASKNINVTLQTPPRPVRVGVLCVSVLLLLAGLYRLSHRDTEASIDLNPKFQTSAYGQLTTPLTAVSDAPGADQNQSIAGSNNIPIQQPENIPANPPALQPEPANPPALQQYAVNQPALQQEPANQPALQQYPANPPALQQGLANPPSIQQEPANQPALQQYAANQPALQQYPANPTALQQPPASAPALQQEPNKEIAKPQPKIFPVNVLQVPQFECRESKTKLMMFVYSRPENSAERAAIRRSWGRMENSLLPQDEQLWKTFFVMGRTYTDTDQAVARENMAEKDILMGDFPDTPFEDTRKFMLTMRWFTMNSKPCQPKFVMRTQDNVFHNMRAIMNWVQGRFEKRPVTTSNLYLGKILRMDRPIRDPNHALFVPVADYNREVFPEFIQSPVYFLTYQTFVRMSLVMSEVIPIAMEDAYVGLLAEKVGVKATHNDHFHMMAKSIDLCHHLKLFFIFNAHTAEHDTLHQQLKESIQKPECQDYKDADYF